MRIPWGPQPNSMRRLDRLATTLNRIGVSRMSRALSWKVHTRWAVGELLTLCETSKPSAGTDAERVSRGRRRSRSPEHSISFSIHAAVRR